MDDLKRLDLIESVGFSNYVANLTDDDSPLWDFDANMVKIIYQAYREIWDDKNNLPSIGELFYEIADDMMEYIWNECAEYHSDDPRYFADEEYREEEDMYFEEYFWNSVSPENYICEVLDFLKLAYMDDLYEDVVNTAQQRVFEEGELIGRHY